jgi:hypothetical protein
MPVHLISPDHKATGYPPDTVLVGENRPPVDKPVVRYFRIYMSLFSVDII